MSVLVSDRSNQPVVICGYFCGSKHIPTEVRLAGYNGRAPDSRRWPIGEGNMRLASHERRVGQVLVEAPGRPPTETGSAHRDKDTKYDPDYCRKRNGLQKHTQASSGKGPPRQQSLDGKIPMRA